MNRTHHDNDINGSVASITVSNKAFRIENRRRFYTRASHW